MAILPADDNDFDLWASAYDYIYNANTAELQVNNGIQNNTLQCNAKKIQYYTIPYNTTQYSTIQYNTLSYILFCFGNTHIFTSKPEIQKTKSTTDFLTGVFLCYS